MTDAQRRANNKYISTLDLVQLRMPKGARQQLRDAAVLAGLSLNEYCIRTLLGIPFCCRKNICDICKSCRFNPYAGGCCIYTGEMLPLIC